jgi:hypothetical protein
MATLQELLGGGLPPGLLSPAQQQAAEQRAQNALLTNLGFALLQSSRGQPGQKKPSIGQVIGQAGPVGLQAYQQSFDKTLADALKGIQIQDLMAKRADEERVRQAQRTFQDRIAAATTMQPTTMGAGPEQLTALTNQMLFPGESALSAEDAALTQRALLSNVNLPRRAVTDEAAANQAVMDYLRVASPVEYAKLTAKEPKESFKILTKEEAKQRGLPEDRVFQVSSSGKVDEVGRGPLVKNVVGGEQSPFLRKAQEQQAAIFGDIKKSGDGARRTLNDITRLGSILEKSPGGLEAGFKLAAGNFGIKTEGLDNLQTAEAIINRLVPQQRPPGTGQMSDADLDLFKKSLPRIINQPGGNKAIISYLKGINEYLIKEGEIASLVLNGKITPEEADQRMLALQNPLEEFKNSAAGGLPPGVTVTPIGR